MKTRFFYDDIELKTDIFLREEVREREVDRQETRIALQRFIENDQIIPSPGRSGKEELEILGRYALQHDRITHVMIEQREDIREKEVILADRSHRLDALIHGAKLLFIQLQLLIFIMKTVEILPQYFLMSPFKVKQCGYRDQDSKEKNFQREQEKYLPNEKTEMHSLLGDPFLFFR